MGGTMHIVKHLWNHKGLTLIELLIVTAIFGIMAEVVDYGFLRQMPKRRLQGAATLVAWDLMEARSLAIKQHSQIRLSFPDNHVYTIWNDVNHNGAVDTNEESVKDIQQQYGDIIFDISETDVANPLFTSRGTSSGNSSILIKSSAGSKTISINISGFVVVD
jgi:prepilin-type N-terminal cleavage/methylation domain-containing protein